MFAITIIISLSACQSNSKNTESAINSSNKNTLQQVIETKESSENLESSLKLTNRSYDDLSEKKEQLNIVMMDIHLLAMY